MGTGTLPAGSDHYIPVLNAGASVVLAFPTGTASIDADPAQAVDRDTAAEGVANNRLLALPPYFCTHRATGR